MTPNNVSGGEDVRSLERADATSVTRRLPARENPSYNSHVTAGLQHGSHEDPHKEKRPITGCALSFFRWRRRGSAGTVWVYVYAYTEREAMSQRGLGVQNDTGYQKGGALNEVQTALDVGVTTRKIYIHIYMYSLIYLYIG